MKGLILVVALLGCSKAKPEGRPRLVTDAEVTQLEADVMGRLVKPVCVPDEDVRKLIEPPPSITACVQPLMRGKARDLVAARDPIALTAERTCGTELATLLETAGTGGRCSPYQVGHTVWNTFASGLVAGQIIELRSRLLADAGDLRGALDGMVRLAAFGQNLGRGRTGILPAMVGAEVALNAATTAGSILNTHALAPADLDALVLALDQLIADRPSFLDVMSGELDFFALQDYLPRLKPAGWIPPGGWPAAEPTPVPTAAEGYLDVREEGAFLMYVNRAQDAAYAAACPAEASVKACSDGLTRLSGAGRPDMTKLLGELTAEPDPHAGLARVRKTLVEALVSVGAGEYVPYANKAGAVPMRWGAVRLHLEVLRAGHCPTEAELTAAPFAALRSPPGLGDALIITSSPEAISIAPPAWVESKREPYRITCPPQRK